MTEVFVFGRGGDDQLGIGKSCDFIVKPTLLDNLEVPYVIQIACGGKHTVFCTQQGNVLSTGWGWHGQLGHGDVQDRLTPQLVKPLALISALHKKRFVKVAAGDEHTVVLSSDGQVYVFGGNSDGQLGTGDAGEKVFSLQPKLLLPLHNKKIIDIACGGRHTLCVTGSLVFQPIDLSGSRLTSACHVRIAEGQVYAWGKGKEGRLGCATQDSSSIPHPVVSLNAIKIVSVEAGWSHSMCLSVDGHCFTWGCGRDGALGLGHRDDIYVPFLVKYFVDRNIVIKKIAAGYSNSAAIDINGNLYTWGFGENAQLGHPEVKTETLPRQVMALEGKNTTHISFGGFHTLAIADGVCYSWGVGCHYQLGNESSQTVATPTVVPQLKDRKALYVCAGLWHSFVVVAAENSSQQQSLQDIELVNADLELEMDTLRERVLQDEQESTAEASAAAQPKTDAPPPSFAQRVSRLFSVSIFGSSAADDSELVRYEKSQDTLIQTWNSLLPRWHEVRGTSEVKKLLRHGIPSVVRAKAWLTFVPNTLGITPEKYDNLCEEAKILAEKARQYKTIERHQNAFSIIEVDVPRTFPETHFFAPDGPLHNHLTDVLRAYAVLNPETSYVQGMCYLAGHLLMYMDPYSAFQVFANLVNNHFFQSLFRMHITQIYRHIRIYEILLAKNCPEIYKRFEQLQVTAEYYLLEWFITAFTKSLPLAIVSRVWDNFLVEGEIYLHRTAIAILKLNEKFILQAPFEICVQELRNLGYRVKENILFRTIRQIQVPEYIPQFIQLIDLSGKHMFASQGGNVPPV